MKLQVVVDTNILDAAGLSPLERCGAILDERASQRAAGAGEK